VTSTRSCGVTWTCRPRLPALTYTVSQRCAEESTKARSLFRWPNGLIPPVTYPVAFSARDGSAIAALFAPAEVEGARHRDDRHHQFATAELRDQGLEDGRRIGTHRRSDGFTVRALVALTRLVAMDSVSDALSFERLDGRSQRRL
jgi:hypothetical protein